MRERERGWQDPSPLVVKGVLSPWQDPSPLIEKGVLSPTPLPSFVQVKLAQDGQGLLEPTCQTSSLEGNKSVLVEPKV